MYFYPTFYMYSYCITRVKFGITNLHIMMLSICKFRENRCREGRKYFMDLNEITFAHVPWNRKNALVKSVYYVPRTPFVVVLYCCFAIVIITYVRKIAKTDYWLPHVCLSVRPSACNNSAPTKRNSWNLMFEYFSKARWEKSSFMKIWQQ